MKMASKAVENEVGNEDGYMEEGKLSRVVHGGRVQECERAPVLAGGPGE